MRTKEPSFHFSFPGKVEQQHAHRDEQNSLARCQQHDRAGSDEQQTQHVLGRDQHNSEQRMMLAETFKSRSWSREIVDGYSRNHQQGKYDAANREQHGQPDKPDDPIAQPPFLIN